MTAIGRLIDADPRAAWRHEAIDFTPWLAQNLDQLGEVIGRELEAEGTEIRVGAFSADILARDIDGDLVLIENQLEATDHSHLGQIMTYLAGLEAKTVVWIATGFREEHLAAINWLNEHTVDPFAFFAIRLRVVRIGDSAPAPIFDVAARPNAWERRMQKVARKAEREISDDSRTLRAFWQAHLGRHPEDAAIGVKETASTNVWLTLDAPTPVILSLYRAKDSVGLFLRGPSGADPDAMRQVFEPFAPALEARLEVPMGTSTKGQFFPCSLRTPRDDPGRWPEASDWLHQAVARWRAAVTDVMGGAA